MIKRIKAQSTLEYAMVIVCIAGALIAMQIYVKRSIQGRLRNAADETGEQYSAKTTTSLTNQNIASTTTIVASPIIVDNLSDPDDVHTSESREFIVPNRTENQTLTQNPGNYEETGKFEDKLFN